MTDNPVPDAGEQIDWRDRGCTIAGRKPDTWCGEPIHGAVMVQTYSLPLDPGMEDAPKAGGVLVCRHHFRGLTAPPFPPDINPVVGDHA